MADNSYKLYIFFNSLIYGVFIFLKHPPKNTLLSHRAKAIVVVMSNELEQTLYLTAFVISHASKI